MSDKENPYKTYLTEDELPTAWYNLRADMKKKPVIGRGKRPEEEKK